MTQEIEKLELEIAQKKARLEQLKTTRIIQAVQMIMLWMITHDTK